MSEDEPGAIARLIAAGDDQAAFARLRAGLGWPHGRGLSETELPRWLDALAALAERRGAPLLGELTRGAIRDPASPDQLYELGYALIDAGAPAIAATVLWRCLALVGDSEEVVCELVSALESALAYPDALALLEQHAPLRARSFLCRYLYAFNAAMAGKLAITRAALPQLDPEDPESEAMQETIARIVERADRIESAHGPLGARDLRGWHYVLTGGLLVHQSPYGFDQPMHGRYAWLADSLPRVATGIERLAALVAPLGLPCVYTPEGHSNEILALAVAARLQLPVMPWPAVGVPAPGLVVLYDLAELPAAHIPQLVQRRPEQILFAHATPWTTDSPVAPDVTTLLYQTLVPPWAAPVVVDPATREVTSAVVDERGAAEIAAEIAASPGLDDAELSADDPVRWAAFVEQTWPLAPGPRARVWAGGAVPSSRFM